MTLARLGLAAALSCLAWSAMAAPTPAVYTLSSMTATTTGGVGTSNGTSWNASSPSAYGAGGTDYGNTYSWNGASTGNGPALSISAWGSTSLSVDSTIHKAWIGNYGSNGYGITSQSGGELNGAHKPDASSPLYQHAIDNTSAYESLMFSFASSVTLNSVSIGFKGNDADATVLAYKGAGDPAASLSMRTYAQLLSSGDWVIAGNLLDMSTVSANTLSTSMTSRYWMVGAYTPIGTNATVRHDATADQFKITGFSAIRALPEPDSLALFAVADATMLLGRRPNAPAA